MQMDIGYVYLHYFIQEWLKNDMWNSRNIHFKSERKCY